MSVGKEKNGTYTVQCWYREQLTGERHKKTKRGFKRKSDAVRWERDFLMKAAGSPTMKFADYCEVYRSDMLPRLKRNTWRTKEYIIRDKILPYFGDKALSDISPADVLEWQTRLISRIDPKTTKPYKKTYLRTVNNILSAMLNHAVRFYGLPSNPMKRTGKIGSAKAEEMKFWTKDEYLRFAEEVMDKPGSFAIFELLYWCGIREGEALALMPEDFDFDKGLLKITKSYQRIDRQDVITSPKTAKSVRTVTMPDFVAEELSEYIELEGYEEGECIFPFGKSYLYHEMDRGCKASGVKRIRVHDLRHSHVSLLIEMGFSVVAIADRVGHESTDITFRYAHLFPNTQGDMARKLSQERRQEHER